eukprot:TRINITY_DN66724_c4_g5_i1.p1 TRINITY_DN66724_c4_g5~~TRINITY_DN66724_c4_g5_i1.p1  ORF type:complete len:114 (+),score=13.34 TRINITY_DN66724_c4_g5_i1:85-426(+)
MDISAVLTCLCSVDLKVYTKALQAIIDSDSQQTRRLVDSGCMPLLSYGLRQTPACIPLKALEALHHILRQGKGVPSLPSMYSETAMDCGCVDDVEQLQAHPSNGCSANTGRVL